MRHRVVSAVPGVGGAVHVESRISKQRSGGSRPCGRTGAIESRGVIAGEKLLCVSILSALLSGACSQQSVPSPVPAARVHAEETVTIPQDLAGVEITLERTECFGSCPNYTVVVDGNGHVKYSGRSWVREKGEHEATISKDEARTLVQRFVRAGFFSLNDSYEQAVTDCATTYLSVKIGDRVKRIENYWAHDPTDLSPEQFDEWKAHATLDMLAYCVDEAVDVERWIGSREARQKLKDPEGYPGRTEMPK